MVGPVCMASQLPKISGFKLQNRPLTETDIVLYQINTAWKNALKSDARSLSDREGLLLKWWKLQWLLCRDLLRRTASRLVKIRNLWYVIGRRLVRRKEEANRHSEVWGLVDSWTMFKRPSTWNSRRKFRCWICILDYFEEADLKQRRRQFKASAYRVFEDVPSQCWSMTDHVKSYHAGLGDRRICVVCKKRCASEHGVLEHQLRQHVPGCQDVAASNLKNLVHNLRLDAMPPENAGSSSIN